MAQILEHVFDDQSVYKRLRKVVDDPINQSDKIDKLCKILDNYGLKIFDSGTNRVVFKHKKYPEVVFKIAMDEQGVLDNLNEYEKSDKSPHLPDSNGIDYDGYVLVQRRDKRIDQGTYETDEVQKGIRKMLQKLSEDFVLIDLGMDKRKNFGIDDKGRYSVLDFGYITYKSLANFNCPLDGCKGTLDYTKNFAMMKCDKCGNKFKPDVVLEGYAEHKYAVPPKSQKFIPSKELEEFYKQFKDSRDMSTLKKYVSLNNTQTTDNRKAGEEQMATTKESFLSKVQAFSGSRKADTTQQSNSMQQKKVQLINTAPPREEKAHTPLGNGIDAIHRNGVSTPIVDESNIHPDEVLNDEDIAVSIKRLITKQLPGGTIGDEIISELFYARFPDLRVVIESIDIKQVNPPPYHGFIDVERTDNDCVISVDCDKKEAAGKEILLNIQFRGVTFRLDISKHMPLLYDVTQNDIIMDAKLPGAVISYLYAEDKSRFNGDYYGHYYDNGSDSSNDDNSGEE